MGSVLYPLDTATPPAPMSPKAPPAATLAETAPPAFILAAPLTGAQAPDAPVDMATGPPDHPDAAYRSEAGTASALAGCNGGDSVAAHPSVDATLGSAAAASSTPRAGVVAVVSPALQHVQPSVTLSAEETQVPCAASIPADPGKLREVAMQCLAVPDDIQTRPQVPLRASHIPTAEHQAAPCVTAGGRLACAVPAIGHASSLLASILSPVPLAPSWSAPRQRRRPAAVQQAVSSLASPMKKGGGIGAARKGLADRVDHAIARTLAGRQADGSASTSGRVGAQEASLASKLATPLMAPPLKHSVFVTRAVGGMQGEVAAGEAGQTVEGEDDDGGESMGHDDDTGTAGDRRDSQKE
jgi:hypothetical protein